MHDNVNHDFDVNIMHLAIEQAKLSNKVQTAYCVGAVLVKLDCSSTNVTPTVVSMGYSRELPGNTHAEEVCLKKLRNTLDQGVNDDHEAPLQGVYHIYTTMEPCGKRLSGLKPCAHRLIEAGVSRVVIGVAEPTQLVEKPEGQALLLAHGIKVEYLRGLEGNVMKSI